MNLRIPPSSQDAKITIAFPRLSNSLYQKPAVENSDIYKMALVNETVEAAENSLFLIPSFQILFKCINLVSLNLSLVPSCKSSRNSFWVLVLEEQKGTLKEVERDVECPYPYPTQSLFCL